MAGLPHSPPYIAFHDIKMPFYSSVVCTLTALAVFGLVKRKFAGVSKIKSALQTLLVGRCTTGVAYALAELISSDRVPRLSAHR